MANPNYPMSADEDLPRALRREKEAREREAHGRTLDHRPGSAADAPGYRAPESDAFGAAYDDRLMARGANDSDSVTVRAVRIPFLRLMVFFIKAVFAAIPALILLGALLWLAGDLLMAYFPQLVKMQIIIKVPN